MTTELDERSTAVDPLWLPGSAPVPVHPDVRAAMALLGPIEYGPEPDGFDDDSTAWTRALAALAPGPALAAVVASAESDQPTGVDVPLTDAEVVEIIAAAARIEAWAHAQAALWAGRLAQRPAMHPWGGAGTRPEDGCTAASELAMRLSRTRRSAAALVAEGVAYDGRLAQTGAALSGGTIDAPRARVLVDRLTPDLPVDVTWEVEERVLPRAGSRTVEQLRRDVERALAEVDPEGAAARHQRATRCRRLSRPRALPDGMAGLWWVLPASDAARVDALLESAARSARSAGDARTLVQLRSDGLRDLAFGADGPSRVPATVHVTVPLTTLLGVEDSPAELHGHGAIDAETARRLAMDAGSTWRRLVTDPVSGSVLDLGRTRYRPSAALAEHVRVRDRHCAAPGCDIQAERCDLDHTIEFHRAAGPPGSTGPASPRDTGSPSLVQHADSQANDRRDRTSDGRGRTAADNLGPLCRHHHRLKTDGGFTLRQPRPGVFEWRTAAGLRYRVRPGGDDRQDNGGSDPPF